MNLFFESLAVAFSMYSRFPMPQFEWNEKNMRWSLAFFPLVGVVIAAVLYGIYYLFLHFAMSPVFFSAAGVLVPVIITGGIHIDGFCDTCDALASHGNLEAKLKIMKDPHVGAFGVIYTCSMLLLEFGAWHQIYLKPGFIIPALAAPMLSRALAALAILHFPKAKGTGLAATFSNFASKGPATAVLVFLAALAASLTVAFHNPLGLLVVAAALLLFLEFHRMAKKQFGGITGDLAGFYVSTCETLVLVLCAILGAVF